MHRSLVSSPAEAVAYLVDCTLATVSDLAGKRSRSESELRRQIAIAQQGCDWLRAFSIDATGTRAPEILAAGISVADWARQHDARATAG